jgi:hypothetical protein
MMRKNIYRPCWCFSPTSTECALLVWLQMKTPAMVLKAIHPLQSTQLQNSPAQEFLFLHL